MKKKQTFSRNIQTTPHQQKIRNNSNTVNIARANRRQDSNNKQNIIQITEPLYSNQLPYPTKEFALSKQSINSNCKSNLKDVNMNPNVMLSQNGRQIMNKYDKEQELIDRRLSLKCTVNNSQQDRQKSQRLSMTPLLRREVNGMSSAYPQSFAQERQSLSSINQQYLMYSDSKLRHQIKKEAIIINLVDKLEHQQDLRTIIQSKLRNNSSQYLLKDRKNQSYFTNFTEQNSNLMASKLKQCQNQIKYFKSIIRQMSDKIIDITSLRESSKISQRVGEYATNNSQNNANLITLLKKVGKECLNCQQYRVKTTKQISTQTIKNQQHLQTQYSKVNQSFDFVDHIEQTLKVLDYRKY